MKFHNVRQNSDEWDSLRAGKITSSSLSKAMANYGKAFGDPAKKYASQIALEQIIKAPISGSYTNSSMDRGHEEEPLARMEYENQYFCDVLNGGFFEDGDCGCSPDGLVGNDGLIEIKSAEPHIHLERIRKQTFDSAYKWQLIGNMKLCKRKWIDFVSFCKEFPEGKRIFVYRLKSENYINEYKMIDNRMGEFRGLIKKSKDLILKSKYYISEDNNG